MRLLSHCQPKLCTLFHVQRSLSVAVYVTSVQGTVNAAKQALSNVDRSAIKAVGVSGQQHGMVVLDKQDKVLRPAKLWCDTESAGEAAELSQKLGYAVVSSKGSKFQSTMIDCDITVQ